MAQIIVTTTTEEEGEQSTRFQTYVNYLTAIDNYLTSQYPEPRNLIEVIAESPSFQKIQGGRCSDQQGVQRLLRNAWFTEIQMHISALHQELVPYSNHWIPVQLYYGVYLAVRAYFSCTGQQVGEHHATTLRRVSNDIANRPALFPYPWKVLCTGDQYGTGANYLNLPPSTQIGQVSSLTSGKRVSFWDSYVMLLRTTRMRQVERAVDEWKKKEGRKRITRPNRETVVSRIPPTSMFDALYRLRIRSNYADADSFLLSLDDVGKAMEFNQSIRSICWWTMLLLETLSARYIGKGKFNNIVAGFLKHDIGNQSEQLVQRRWTAISSVL